MPKRYNNIIYKLFLKKKKIIKVILSSMIRIGLIICIEDPKEAFGIDHIHKGYWGRGNYYSGYYNH